MTDKKYRRLVKKLGGQINAVGSVDFPDTLSITTKKDAMDLMDVLIYDYIGGYVVSVAIPFEKLKAAIKRGIA